MTPTSPFAPRLDQAPCLPSRAQAVYVDEHTSQAVGCKAGRRLIEQRSAHVHGLVRIPQLDVGDGSSVRWLADIDVCLKKPEPLGTGCTIYRGRPGRCEWQYIDPPQVAAQAVMGQLTNQWDPSRLFTSRESRP
ncbi:hypothetical protein Srubr_77720 [Streptomyces rubradiris]|uniref:Uncharacterized protein n=1 Tax=Streptomyces rubradiris TaxID=285531 RepID=A0ABQ3RPX6_STRRR|nr:hypothetical protein GCM10018792_48790 [Streptomyces rubradiris]GHI57926.1 hypothetical protein Srubr_77720 [Streptomyces rubradiris]